ncbi:uncharacterized protein LY79DRAFT_581045 [Colletotrichum navitas]|uniref:Uncharacterized protein n=1 Tax=Colletotrichum navitas TaxID=681940 RepID=A0AAD8PX52_9PEZI|nr:uncharacterized protein LY79DRAFT_581045 [Colletotrichum navitas]KAK1585423.1 hypothetical protein LY79DRAFT_581045 [Colletotrichum navitas]
MPGKHHNEAVIGTKTAEYLSEEDITQLGRLKRSLKVSPIATCPPAKRSRGTKPWTSYTLHCEYWSADGRGTDSGEGSLVHDHPHTLALKVAYTTAAEGATEAKNPMKGDHVLSFSFVDTLTRKKLQTKDDSPKALGTTPTRECRTTICFLTSPRIFRTTSKMAVQLGNQNTVIGSIRVRQDDNGITWLHLPTGNAANRAFLLALAINPTGNQNNLTFLGALAINDDEWAVISMPFQDIAIRFPTGERDSPILYREYYAKPTRPTAQRRQMNFWIKDHQTKTSS